MSGRSHNANCGETPTCPAVVGPASTNDAAHIAVSAVHNVDYLMTWNCAHLANAMIIKTVEKVCADNGFICPVICTPEELMEQEISFAYGNAHYENKRITLELVARALPASDSEGTAEVKSALKDSGDSSRSMARMKPKTRRLKSGLRPIARRTAVST